MLKSEQVLILRLLDMLHVRISALENGGEIMRQLREDCADDINELEKVFKWERIK